VDAEKSSGAGLRGFKSRPPHQKISPFLRLIRQNKANFRRYVLKLEIEHQITGKCFSARIVNGSIELAQEVILIIGVL
jgi:hypothetical protein